MFGRKGDGSMSIREVLCVSLLTLGFVLDSAVTLIGQASRGAVAQPAQSSAGGISVPCQRSHAGGASSIRCEMALDKAGIRWTFLEAFKRQVSVPWANLKEWECYGEVYGYSVDLIVTSPDDGGGTFSFSGSDRASVVKSLNENAAKKKLSLGACRP